MAKSIFEILDTLKTETSVPATGKSMEHSLPRNLFPTSEQFESEEKLLAWAKDNGCLHACLQSGIQKFLIDIRAIFKSQTKTEVWTIDLGQKKVNEAKWTIVERPKAGGIAKVKAQAELTAGINMANAMHRTGIDKTVILASLVKVYGEDVAQTIVDSLTN